MQTFDKKEWIARQQAKGLCVQCGQPTQGRSKRYCAKCLKDFNERAKKRQAALVREGRCKRCAQPTDRVGCSLCSVCLQRDRDERRARTGERQKQGLCHKCGRAPAVVDGQKCVTCYLKHLSNRHLGSAKRWRELFDLFESQGGVCPYSGKNLIIGLDAEIDHIMPRAKGGADDIDNLQWVNCRVNLMKQDLLDEEFRQFIRLMYAHMFTETSRT